MIKYIVIFYSVFVCFSCASLSQLWNEGEKSEGQKASAMMKYTDNPQVGSPSERQYKRMTRSKMEEESDLQSNAGSLWLMEGQQSYLFAQNKTRREGDILNVKMEGSALKQVETKVGVIKKLLKQLEEEEKRRLNPELEQTPTLANGTSAGGATDRTPASATPASTATNTKSETAKAAADDKADLSDVQTIQTKIVEKMPDGNYRVKGAQPFMIGSKEYKVIVSGVVRPEDYNDEGLSSAKLLDPQFDVVSLKRKVKDDKGSIF